MEALTPLINLVVLMGTLSVAVERLANLVKLRHPDLRESRQRTSRSAEKDRERRIANRVLIVSVALALVVKADLFAILAQLEAPWRTLGWSRSTTPASPAGLLTTLAGTVLTGLWLGFGSKFWHDLLDILHDARARLSRHLTPDT
ncbi:MAG TPA: hypothetical protein VNL98_12330 [Gemmatimonadales bacterium]|nr:hypothetical protein [Gemmatimonadales bacterium]